MVNSGRASVSEDGTKATFRSGSYFGASVSARDTFRGNISFLEESVCGVIPVSEIYAVLNKSEDSKPKIGKINVSYRCFGSRLSCPVLVCLF